MIRSTVVAILLLIGHPAFAADPHLSLTTGLDYSIGDYGTPDDTETWFLPLNLKYQSGHYSFKLGMSYLFVRGPQSVTPDGDPIPGGGVVKTTHGFGDVTAAFTVEVLDERNYPFGLDLTGKIKFGTASEDKALGTGENDYTLQASFYKPMGAWMPYLDVAHRWKGDPPGIDYQNVWYVTAGSSYRINKAWSLGADYAWREKLTSGGDEISEATLYANYKINDHNKLNLYGVAGFSDASPDWGLGFMTTHSF
ncbi:MAG: hypothetical protein HXY27_07135 [Hydrogenophilaceae bacterium]|nr:hypothetical protein [Hydrogenophilaceae bacterium]